KEWVNPFLPYEKQLWVRDVSNTHTLLLNKFNVVAHHLICVTRTFKRQTDPLDAADLAATWEAMQAYPNGALAYFNCGPESGASQPHKHTQIVPLPLAEDTKGLALPFEGDPYCICTRTAYSKSVCGGFRPSARDLEQVFNTLKASFGSAAVPEEGSPESYNMVLTSSYMMLVPRSREVYGLVAVNSMGFAGSMLVRSKAELDFIRSESPMRILAAVGIPWP
ncbi:hypothetical protein COCSUDRAFT_83450, partial [Coccomyxa subellipsoidea C-169]